MSITVLNAEIPNANHPKLGDKIKVEPIRTVNAINKLKRYLAPSPRNFALLVMGVNTVYRASELLSIRLRQIRHLQPGDRLDAGLWARQSTAVAGVFMLSRRRDRVDIHEFVTLETCD